MRNKNKKPVAAITLRFPMGVGSTAPQRECPRLATLLCERALRGSSSA